MPREDDEVRLRHMLDAANEATGYIQGRSREDLDSDRQLVHSLVRCVEIVGEVANKVSPELRDAHPGIPWSRIVGMRNRLIHAYFDVNPAILWKTVNDELPSLISAVEVVLGQEQPNTSE